MTIRSHYVVKSHAEEGLMDSRFRPSREHILPGTTGIAWWSPQTESNDFLDDKRVLWAFDSKENAASFAHWATTRWPGYDFIVLTAVEGFRAAAAPAKKFTVSDKGVLPA